MRQVFLLLVGLASLTGSGCSRQAPDGAAEPPPLAARPHVLLISLDACRADRLGCYGHDRETSPFLDRLAREGTRFSRAFAATHGTPPAHTSMLSGLYQETHGVHLDGPPPAGVVERVPARVVMIQEILRGSGYVTVGVSGGGHMSSGLGFGRGFVDYDDRPGPAGAQKMRLLELLERHWRGDQPLFMLFHTYEIHSPYEPPEPWRDRFGSFASTIEPTNEVLMRLANSAASLAPDDLDQLRALYDAEIRYTDTVLAELFRRLGEMGILDRTLVVITSDHGEEFGEHGGLLHRGTLYEELIHVPLILWGVGVPRGVVDDRLVSAVDIVPTILVTTGLSAPQPLPGRDLLGSGSAGTVEEGRPAVYSQFGRKLYGVREGRWKLIQWSGRDDLLFDLDLDPGERTNVVGDHPEVAARLRADLAAWRKGVAASGGTEKVEVSAEERAHLEALGYVGGEMGEGY